MIALIRTDALKEVENSTNWIISQKQKMKQYNVDSLVIGLRVLTLTIWVFFLAMKLFTGIYPGSGDNPDFKGQHNVVQRFILDSASRSWHIETRLMYRRKEGPMINLEMIFNSVIA